MFFADGDFQSTQLYALDTGLGFQVPSNIGTPIRGNVARIDYCLANSPHPITGQMMDPRGLAKRYRILGCRRHILTTDLRLDPWPVANNIETTFAAEYAGYKKNELYEHDSLSLAQWKVIDRTIYGSFIIPECFRFKLNINSDPKTYHKLVCNGVGCFTVQWSYWDPGPDNIKNTADDFLWWFPDYSQFDIINSDEFGVYFNIPKFISGPWPTGWYSIKDEKVKYRMDSGQTEFFFPYSFYPKALKFTFKIYDSKGIIKEGRTFTHIVYLSD